MSLSFSDPRFDEVKASVEECKDKDMTYAAPLFVTAEFTNNTTGEIKSQTVFMGDFPVMTDKGTFIINGTERVVVSQLVRSPGRLLRPPRSTSPPTRTSSRVKIIPSRGAWLEFDVDKRDTVGVRIDRKRRQPVTVLLKALGWTAEQIQQRFGFSETMLATLEKDHTAGPGRGPARHLPQAAPGRAAHQGERADAAGEPVLQGQALRPGEGRPLQGQQEAGPRRSTALGRHAHRGGHRHHHRVPRPAARGRDLDDGRRGRRRPATIPVETDDIDHFGNRRLRTVGELIQNQIRVGLSRMERVVRERMTTQDVEAITPQTLINIRPVVAAIKEFFGTSQLSQFMDQTNPLAGPDPQAPPVGAGPGRSVP